MKIKLLILAIAIFFVSQTAFAQTGKEIARIRAEVNLINKNAKNYTKTTKTVEGVSLEGAEAVYFVSGKGLKKVVAQVYGETYKATIELYYAGEELIFAYQKTSRYDTQIGMNPPPKVVKIEEKRLYFTDGKLIKLLIGKKNEKKGSQVWQDSESETRETADKLKSAYEN